MFIVLWILLDFFITSITFVVPKFRLHRLLFHSGQVKTVKPEYDKPPWEKIEEILDASIDNDLIIGITTIILLTLELFHP